MEYLNLMNEDLDITKLAKLYTHLYNPKIDVEFTDVEVQKFNECVRKKDIASIENLFEIKSTLNKEVLKDIINGKTDDLWQFIMDHAYDKWKDNNMSREEFLNQLTDYEKIAVKFGNFNYQVENGGLFQWDDNGYSDDLDSLYDFINDSSYSKKDKFLEILDNFSNVKSAIEELDDYSDWYEEDRATRLNSLNYCDKDYYNIKDSWIAYFNDYLINNIPDDYVKEILSISEDIKI